MTRSVSRRLRCPVCADDFEWSYEPTISLYDKGKGSYEQVDISSLPQLKRDDLMRTGYRQCPNPSRDTAEHYLPATYADYGDPLVIGLVGAPFSGKTHLLTAMIREAHLNGLARYGIKTAALDIARHRRFRRQFIEKFEQGGALEGTHTGVVEAADILLLRGPNGNRPVTFFDVAGEDLENPDALNRSSRFLLGANAVIFVHPSEDTLRSANHSFELAIERLRGRGIPAAIAVTKSDRLRYMPPADRWLHRGDEQVLDADRIRDESRDVYAYLHKVGAGASLGPFDAFSRCTLHFVSASGGDPLERVTSGQPKVVCFPRGFRPMRVLEPLVALLAMTGMIADPEAGKVGMP